ncbi:MAG TPA: ABC transporter permease [Chitinophagaceae bacterium]|nr:ABC transporter permease [Chitinophagaceae bacterium]
MIKNFFLVAYRNLAKNKATAILNISGLAIGVTVCLVIGIWLQRELSFDKFHPDGKQIFRIANTFKSESESFSQAPSGPAFGAHLTKELPAVQATCRVFIDGFKVKTNNEAFIENNAAFVDSNFFSFFGFKLLKGNAKQVLQSPDQMVITEKLAIKYFGSVDEAIGKTLEIDGQFPKIVSGVAENTPVNSQIQYDLVLAFSHLRNQMMKQYDFDPNNLWVGGWPHVYVRLNDPAKWKEAEKLVNSIAARFSDKEWKENKMSYTYFLQPIEDIHLKSKLRYDSGNNGSQARVNVFSIVGIIVLLLACINYINLTTAGAIKRARETSVRKVVGATKIQLIRQFFLETFLVCAVSVMIGIILLRLILPGFSTWIGQPYEFPLSIVNVLIIAGFVLFISLIAGIYPAAVLSSFNPSTTLKGNFVTSAKGNFIRKGLVVFQFTITIALVASIIIISRQMNFIKSKSLGFEGNAVVEVRFFGAQSVRDQYISLRNQLMQSPYVLNVSKHNQNVVGGLGNGWTTTENLKGEEISTSLYNMGVDTTFADVYNLKLAAGRFFSKSFPTDTSKAVLVNEAAVRTFGWRKPENAIGKRFGKGDDARYVIGVIRDFNFESLHKPVEALMIEYAKSGNRLSLKIDARHAEEAINHMKKIWKTSVPDIPLEYTFVDESIEKQYGNEQKMQGIFYGFAGLSLLIACLGLFGLSIFVVERKVKEIGIRKVLGASVPGIVGLLSKDFLKLVLIAAVIASPLAWYFMREWLQDFAYRVDIGWWVFGIAGAIALLIALFTVSFRAIRAAMANPVDSLRSE